MSTKSSLVCGTYFHLYEELSDDTQENLHLKVNLSQPGIYAEAIIRFELKYEEEILQALQKRKAWRNKLARRKVRRTCLTCGRQTCDRQPEDHDMEDCKDWKPNARICVERLRGALAEGAVQPLVGNSGLEDG